MYQLPLTVTEQLDRWPEGQAWLATMSRLDAQVMEGFTKGLIKWEEVEKFRAHTEALAQAQALAIRAAKLNRKAAAIVKGKTDRAPRCTHAQHQALIAILPWQVRGNDGLTKCEKRVAAALKIIAGHGRTCIATYGYIAKVARCSRRTAISACKVLKHLYIEFEHEDITETYSTPNTFTLKDELYAAYGQPGVAHRPTRRRTGPRRSPDPPVQNSEVQKIAPSQGELRNSLVPGDGFQKCGPPPAPGRADSGIGGPESGQTAPPVRPDAAALGNSPDGSLPLAGALARGERASTVPPTSRTAPTPQRR